MQSTLKNKALCEGLYNIVAGISGIVILFSCAQVFGQQPNICPSQPGYFTDPSSFTADLDGNYYVVDRANDRVQKFTKDCELLLSIGGKDSKPPEFSSPESIALDEYGNFYVVDTGNARVRVFNKDGQPKPVDQSGHTDIGKGILKKPKGIYINNENHIYVTEVEDSSVQKFNAMGDLLLIIRGEILPEIGATGFDVSKNGFKFANTDNKSGKCGGMCFAAMDLFCAGYSVPEIDEMSDILQTDFGNTYLTRRQQECASPAVLDKIRDWMSMDEITISEWTRKEFDRLKKELSKGHPSALILINKDSRKTGDNKANHMVLANRYVYYDKSSKRATIYIYDPNYRQEEQYLKFTPGNPGEIIVLTLNGLPVRGFFISADYKPDTTFPKEGLEVVAQRKNACPWLDQMNNPD